MSRHSRSVLWATLAFLTASVGSLGVQQSRPALGAGVDPASGNDMVVFFDLAVAPRNTFFARSKADNRGRYMLEVAFGQGLKALSIEVHYKEAKNDPKVRGVLKKLASIINDGSRTSFDDAVLTKELGLTFDRFGD